MAKRRINEITTILNGLNVEQYHSINNAMVTFAHFLRHKTLQSTEWPLAAVHLFLDKYVEKNENKLHRAIQIQFSYDKTNLSLTLAHPFDLM